MFGKTKSPDDQPALPGAPSPSGFSGPVIPGTGQRLEQAATLAGNAEALMAQAPPDRCLRPGCSGKLGVFRGTVLVDGGGGVKTPEVSERGKRQSFIACMNCRFPVPVNHPRQIALDKEWEQREALDRQEADRAAKQAAAAKANPPQSPPINAMMNVVEAVEAAHDRLNRHDAEIARLVHRVAVLEKALKEHGQPIPF
jgi:hypothetical protein